MSICSLHSSNRHRRSLAPLSKYLGPSHARTIHARKSQDSPEVAGEKGGLDLLSHPVPVHGMFSVDSETEQHDLPSDRTDRHAPLLPPPPHPAGVRIRPRVRQQPPPRADRRRLPPPQLPRRRPLSPPWLLGPAALQYLTPRPPPWQRRRRPSRASA
jgi:hypothetical protein